MDAQSYEILYAVLNPSNRNRFPEIEVDVGSAYECLMMLMLSVMPMSITNYEVGYEWLLQFRSRLSPELQAAIDGLWALQDCSIWMYLPALL